MLITVLMVWMPWLSVSSEARERLQDRSMVLTVIGATIPQAFPLAIPVGLTLGILVGFSGRAVTRHCRTRVLAVAGALAVVSFVILWWIMPIANQAFRVHMFRDGLGQAGYPMRGAAEMTLGELRQRIASAQSFDPALHDGDTWERNYYTRWSVAFAALVLAGFGLSVLTRWRFGRVVGGGVALAACLGYYLLLYAASEGSRRGYLPPIAVAWLPSVIFVVLSLLLVKTGQAESFVSS